MARSIAMPGSTYAYTPAAAPIVERSTIGTATQASIPKNTYQEWYDSFLPTMPASMANTPTATVWTKTARKVADAKSKAAAIRGSMMPNLPLTIQNDLREQIKSLGKDVVLSNLDAEATAATADLATLSDPGVRDKINKADPTYTPSGYPTPSPSETPEQKAFRISKERFASDTTPLIQESLNARGLLESGATPEALARALKGSGEATTAEQLNKVMTDLQAQYAPMNAMAQQMRGNALNQSTQMNANQIAQMLQNMSFEAQQPAQPDILAQLLGTGAGAGLTALLTRRRGGRSSRDLSQLISQRPTAGVTTTYGTPTLNY